MGRLAEMQRKLLEQMMGPETMGLQNASLVWSDEKVCKNFLAGTCPHILFTNTKMDLGPCPKSHADKYKNDYNEEKTKNPTNEIIMRIQREYQSNIFQFVDECDRRIRAAHRRLEKTPEENAKTTNLMREIAEFELAIQGGTEKIESLGEAGEVEESMRELAAVEALKIEKAEKERELQNLTDTSGASGHQKLRVCDVCGAYLSVLDSDRRLADHFGGKMHLGYHELRKMLEEFKKTRMEAPKQSAPMQPPPGPSAGQRPPPAGGAEDPRAAAGRGYSSTGGGGGDDGYRGDRGRSGGGYGDRGGSNGGGGRYDDHHGGSSRRPDRERSRSPRAGSRRY